MFVGSSVGVDVGTKVAVGVSVGVAEGESVGCMVGSAGTGSAVRQAADVTIAKNRTKAIDKWRKEMRIIVEPPQLIDSSAL